MFEINSSSGVLFLRIYCNCSMHSRLIEWSRYALLAGIVLALVLVIPTAWFPFQLAKVAAFAVALLVAAILFVVGGGARDLIRTHGFYAALVVALLPLVYLASSFFSIDRATSIAGFSVETDTLVFVTLAAVAYLLSFTLFRTLRTVRMLTTTILCALVAAVAFQLISVVFGASAIPLATFADRSVNLVGKWNDLGLLTALLALLVFARVELAPASRLWQTAAGVGGVILLALLGLINFPVAWALLLAGCVVVGLLSVVRHTTPWYSLAGAAVAILFLLYGSAINAGITSVFPVSSLEVRPGLQATLDVISAARESSVREALLGTGPNTFGFVWLMHKPPEVNQTPFWNLDFNVGYSALATAFGSAGFLGALAWLLPLILLCAALVRAVRLGVLSREERLVTVLLGAGSLFLLATLVLYVPSQNIILLAFVLSGSAFGFLWRQGRPAQEEQQPSSVLRGVGVLIVAAALLVFTVAPAFVTARRLVAESYAGAGLYALGQGDIDGALARAARAQGIERTANSLRLQADAGVQKLAAIAQDSTLKPEDAQAAFTVQVQSAIPAAQAAIAAAPADYRAYYSLARAYDLLASLKVEGAYQGAQAAYAAAAQRNPTSPSIPLATARLEASQGNAEGTQTAVTRALQLKPDYTDAILFVVQINIANNDLSSAIENTKIAVQTAPGVASIWFQLGLLYYSGDDSKNAVPVLEQALKLVPEYANAKYFLALAYYKEGRQNDALRLFQELAVTNPDNAEVKTIVANLQAGKDPLDGLQPPTAPEDRQTAPVSQ